MKKQITHPNPTPSKQRCNWGYMLLILMSISMVAIPGTLKAEPLFNHPDAPIQASVIGEMGFIGITNHVIQFGSMGTQIDYTEDAGQANLFPSYRISGELELLKKHQFIFMYQPLVLETQQVIQRDIRVHNTVFFAGTPMDFKYGFSFWRFSYLYDFAKKKENVEISLGLSLQIRNADIIFEQSSGAQMVVEQNIGPVPIIKFRAMYHGSSNFFFGTEMDGFYASSKIFNGASYDFKGAIFDISLRGGYHFTDFLSVMLNLRYLGGGAQGTEDSPDSPGDDGYTDNWFHTLGFSIGFILQ